MTIAEIENAIQGLPSAEFHKLIEWLDEYREELWDRQIEKDAEAGRLDAILSKVDAQVKAGLSEPL